VRLRSISTFVLICAGSGACRDHEIATTQSRALEYVGRPTCERCHAEEGRAWAGSDHDRAMTSPAEAGMLANFADHVKYGLGFDPLAQYLVETERGRLQVLPLAWDSRPAALGGQRWFNPNPAIAEPWHGPAFNWNHACAECHSTGVRKNYDAQGDAFATTFAELDVACEACHGRGSEHVRWAESGRASTTPNLGFEFRLRGADFGAWQHRPGEPTATRRAAGQPATELDVCARCHSRRSQIHEDHPNGASLLDTHVPALLEPPLYFDDGQIREEVYEYGSFLQSKMHGAGVTCSDCHDPHSLTLRAPGNALCARCHDPQIFDRPAHHHHGEGSAGAACVECHMPARIYMAVDSRRDHSLRVPRPDLSAALGVPNACARCHPNRAIRGVTPVRTLHYGQVFARARAGDSSMATELQRLVLAVDTALMVRATAASLLGSVTPTSSRVLEAALRHEQPLVRLGALQALDGAPASTRWAAASPLLADPIRAVRFAAVRLLADVSGEIEGSERASFDRAVNETLAAFDLDADRAEANVGRGNLLADLGRRSDAELAYARAVMLDPSFAPAYVNWCELLWRRGDEAGCAAKLGEGLAHAPRSSELHYATALSLIRRGRARQAIPALTTAVRLAPEISIYAYALVVTLRDCGDRDEATIALAAARARYPHDRALRELTATLD
jgi:predicted CXXCH cytochrome family protein